MPKVDCELWFYLISQLVCTCAVVNTGRQFQNCGRTIASDVTQFLIIDSIVADT